MNSIMNPESLTFQVIGMVDVEVMNSIVKQFKNSSNRKTEPSAVIYTKNGGHINVSILTKNKDLWEYAYSIDYYENKNIHTSHMETQVLDLMDGAAQYIARLALENDGVDWDKTDY